jgi:lactoylglutathione lyase
MKFSGFHHIGLLTSDVQRSLTFYTEGLGGKEVFSFPLPSDIDKTIYLVELAEGAVVELIPRGVEEVESNARWAHICLETEDVRGAYEAALAAGAKPRSEPEDGFLGTMERTGAFVFGPDDEVIEFFHVK